MWRFFQRVNAALFLILVLVLLLQRSHNQPTEETLLSGTDRDKLLRLGDKIHALESELRETKSRARILIDPTAKTVSHLDTVVKSNMSFVSLPGPLQYLNHYRGDMEPSVRIGHLKSGLSLVMGIPTVKREVESYLIKTLNSLVKGADGSTEFGIVVFIGDTDETYIGQVASELQAKFGTLVEQGQLELIAPPKDYYPDFNQVKTLNTFGDAPTRIQWRQKQNLDYIYLWMSCIGKSEYYIQLEDDVVANPKFLNFIMTKVRDQIDSWFMLEFSSLGFIGKLFRSHSLTMMSEFVLMFWKDKPVDWLLEHMMYTRVCNPERDMHICQIEKRKIKKTIKPAQFQHVGMHSSLSGKIQKLQDPSFGRRRGVPSFRNPPLLKYYSDVRPYSRFSLPRLYEGRSGFWGREAKAGSVIVLVFKEAFSLAKCRIMSGGVDHPNDVLPEGTEVSFSTEQVVDDFHREDKFTLMGRIDNQGNINLVYDRGEEPRVATLRINIVEATKFWLWIYDIYIERI